MLIIPWNNHHLRDAERLLPAPHSRTETPRVRHHLFPQREDLAIWFQRKGINIHEFTVLIPRDVHERIHRGTRGGSWNEAWARFRDKNYDASKEEIFRHAGELIFRFELEGPVTPYWRRPLP